MNIERWLVHPAQFHVDEARVDRLLSFPEITNCGEEPTHPETDALANPKLAQEQNGKSEIHNAAHEIHTKRVCSQDDVFSHNLAAEETFVLVAKVFDEIYIVLKAKGNFFYVSFACDYVFFGLLHPGHWGSSSVGCCLAKQGRQGRQVLLGTVGFEVGFVVFGQGRNEFETLDFPKGLRD